MEILANLSLLCSKIEVRSIKPISTNKFGLINKIIEITAIKSMLKPFLGLVENLMYQK